MKYKMLKIKIFPDLKDIFFRMKKRN